MPVTNEIPLFFGSPRVQQHTFRLSLANGEQRAVAFRVYAYGADALVDLSGYTAARITARQRMGDNVAIFAATPDAGWSTGLIGAVLAGDVIGAVGSYDLSIAVTDDSTWTVLGVGTLELVESGLP